MIKHCIKCDLCFRRKHIVNGEGTIPSPIMFIGEAPGQREDTLGLPFVGKSGQYLSNILINKFNLLRSKHYYITNVCKCKPEGNIEPTWKEITTCSQYLGEEIANVQPKIICLLGGTALKTFIGNPYILITPNRGIWFKIKDYHIIATYHPSAILQNNKREPEFIHDLKEVALMYKYYNPLHQINI